MTAFSRRALLALPGLASTAFAARRESVPKPYGATPSARQLRWHELETYAFLHFTTNTFTGKEWGYGDEDPNIFNPTQFDADALIEPLAAAGMRGVILTCKHHDGFCLWPTRTTNHSVKSCRWRDGKGDVVRDISQAAARRGLLFGVYLSPWDRNHPAYATPAYVTDVYRPQLRELLTQYGPIFEVWHDGANGGDGYYGGAREKRSIDPRTYYDWPNTWNLVRELQPDAVIFSDVGPDVRWVGNEKGFAAETSWATYDPVGVKGDQPAPGYTRDKEGLTGHRNGRQWLPAECDVSIRPGWFWHEEQNSKVKTARELMDLYYKSVGRGGSFLLNVPPDRRGLLHENDIASLRAFGALRKTTFATNLAVGAKWKMSSALRGQDFRSGVWLTPENVTTGAAEATLRREAEFNVIRVREDVRLGQRVDAIEVDAFDKGAWRKLAAATSIGNCRLIRLEQPCRTRRIRLRVTQASASVALRDFGLFLE